VAKLTAAGQKDTRETVHVAFVNEDCTGDRSHRGRRGAWHPGGSGQLPGAKHGFVLLPRRQAVECSPQGVARFRRLAHDYQRLPQTLTGLRVLPFAPLPLARFAALVAESA